MAHGSRGVDSKLVSSIQIGGVGSFSCSLGVAGVGMELPMFVDGGERSRFDSGSGSIMHRKLMGELEKCFVPMDCSETKFISWPEDVKLRWESLNGRKNGQDLWLLTWNINGRMDLRGCRESLLRRWVLSGPVDVALIQEHFQAGSGTSVNFLNKDWWHVSSDAVGGSIGRKSGGCAVLVQPCLLTDGGFYASRREDLWCVYT